MCLRGWDEATPNVFKGLAAQSHAAWSLRVVVDSEWDPAWPAARAAVASSAAAGATWRAAAIEVLRDRCARRRARCAAPGLGHPLSSCLRSCRRACMRVHAVSFLSNFTPRSQMARPRRRYPPTGVRKGTALQQALASLAPDTRAVVCVDGDQALGPDYITSLVVEVCLAGLRLFLLCRARAGGVF